MAAGKWKFRSESATGDNPGMAYPHGCHTSCVHMDELKELPCTAGVTGMYRGCLNMWTTRDKGRTSDAYDIYSNASEVPAV